MLGLFAAKIIAYRCLPFRFVRVVRAARFLGSVLGLFAAKLGEELDVSVLWVDLLVGGVGIVKEVGGVGFIPRMCRSSPHSSW